MALQEKKKLSLHSKNKASQSAFNDCVDMTMFLCLICFSIYAKMQGFSDKCVFPFHAGIQDAYQKWQKKILEKIADDPANNL